ncbi:MAG: diguanylate cyclase [Betaproteobacteria bacterium]|nr:diguanylate cyclase [Betaproteobacteria bacterium]
MKLERQFLLLVTGVFLFASLMVWLGFRSMTSEINREWSGQIIERQVLFDKYRTFSPLIREIALARKMAEDPALLRMAEDEDNPAARREGLAALEKYRIRFSDHSVFAAFSRTSHYYFNDASSEYQGQEQRYVLSRDNPSDRWFYATLAGGKPYQINISQDSHLKVTKVWINVLLRSGDQVLGVVGTGMNLTEFLAQTVNIAQAGIHNFFIDENLAIQLSGDPQLIDYASIAKRQDQRLTISSLFSPLDVARLQESLRELRSGATPVTSLWVEFHDRRYLLGVAWLPELGWYDLTLVDQKNLVLFKKLSFLPYAMGALFLMALVILGFALHQWVLMPLLALKRASDALQRGDFDVTPPLVGTGEVRDLSLSFRHMVHYVRNSHRELEARVKERTEALHRLTEIDGLTGLLNRRGLMERFDNELARLERTGGTLGVLLLDLDHFKNINDSYGHAAGDLALLRAAEVLRSLSRPYDYAGRFGGEEFLVILPECSRDDLQRIGERIRAAVEALALEHEGQHFGFTTSVGMYHVMAPERRDQMLSKADKALYAAKVAGRNQVRMYGENGE